MRFRPIKSHDNSESALHAIAAQLISKLISTSPRDSFLVVLLVLISGVTEAFGLMLIIPLLTLVGMANDGHEIAPVVEKAVQIATSLGMPFTVQGVLAVFLVLAALRSVVLWYRGVLSVRLQTEFKDRISEELYVAIANASWGHLLNHRRSDIQYMLTNNIQQVGNAGFNLLQMLVAVILATAQFTIAILVSPEVTMVAVIFGVGLTIASRPMLRRSHSLGEELTGKGRILRGYVTDFLDGLKPAKSQNAECAHVQRFQHQVAEVREKQVNFASLNSGTHAALQFTTATLLAGLVLYLSVSASMTLPELALIVVVFSRIIPNVLKLLRQTQMLINALPAYTQLMAMMDELQVNAEPFQACDSVFAVEKEIRTQNLEFKYPRASECVLNHISLNIPGKGIFAITGPSGSGKTTLADLLLGLLEPSRGSIFVDGVKLTNADLRKWRRSVAYVAQEPFLLHESIHSNLLWANPGATEEEIHEALQLASAEFVYTLQNGLETLVGDRGSRLSGGERQRVAVAAALLRNPKLLVLDEPTGQLDSSNENHMVQSLCGLRGHTTVIVITHSVAVLREVDCVLVLDSGRTVACGPWESVATLTQKENEGQVVNVQPGDTV